MDIQAPRRRVLVVDDDDWMRRLMAEALRAHYEVDTARDGAEAWTHVHRAPGGYDAILLDVDMPVMDGLEFLRRLRRHDATCCIPVVMVTAEDSRRVVQECLEAGADDYVVKPFMRSELLRRLDNTLERLDARLLRAAVDTVGGVLHELNQPLQVLRGFVVLAHDDLDGVDGPRKKRLAKALRHIDEASQRLVEVSEQLRRIAQWRTRPYVGNVRIVDLRAAAGSGKAARTPRAAPSDRAVSPLATARAPGEPGDAEGDAPLDAAAPAPIPPGVQASPCADDDG